MQKKFWIIHKILVDFGRFLATLSPNISRKAQNFGVWSFASSSYPFCLTSDQFSSKYFQQLTRKWPKTTQKMCKNQLFSSRFFSIKTTSRRKSEDTWAKENLSQIPNIKSDFRQHLPFSSYSAFFIHHFCRFWPKSELCG